MARTSLPSLTREYSLNEIATMTRASPARLLGLYERGHLGPGAIADVSVYRDQPDRAAMFAAADLVFKNGVLVVRDGKVVTWTRGRTQTVRPAYDPHILGRLAAYTDETWGLAPESLVVDEAAVRPGAFQEHPCRS
jgi:formylmethanofuran dehydrogenase subunit A